MGLRLCTRNELQALCCETRAPSCSEADEIAWKKYRVPHACGPRVDLSAPVWSGDECMKKPRDEEPGLTRRERRRLTHSKMYEHVAVLKHRQRRTERLLTLFKEMGCKEENVPSLGMRWAILGTHKPPEGGSRIDSPELADYLATMPLDTIKLEGATGLWCLTFRTETTLAASLWASLWGKVLPF